MVSTIIESNIIREWTDNNLPVDNHSIENAIILTTAKRYPFIVDPQNCASNWIKNIEQNNSIRIICINSIKLTDEMKEAITFGYPVLIENIGKVIF